MPRLLLSRLSDEQLANRLRRGDDGALDLLYERHHRGLLSFCRHMLRSHEEAEDALQQVFLSAYRALTEKGDRPARVKSWLYAIGRNRCLSIIRSRKELAQPLPDDSADADGAPPERVEERADLRELVADVRRLPDTQRTALVLAEVGDLAHADIAEVLECEPAKVKSLVFQARSALVEQRRARAVPCAEVREEIANMNGSRVKGRARRHVKACPGCDEYMEEIRGQRRLLALALPVVPSFGLRESVLGAVSGGGGGGGGVAAGVALKTGAAGGAGGVSSVAPTGIVAALSAHTAVTKVAVAAVAAGSLAAGAQVAPTEREPARHAAGHASALGDAQQEAGSASEANGTSGGNSGAEATGGKGAAQPRREVAGEGHPIAAASGRSDEAESEEGASAPSHASSNGAQQVVGGGHRGVAGSEQAVGHDRHSAPAEPSGVEGSSPEPSGSQGDARRPDEPGVSGERAAAPSRHGDASSSPSGGRPETGMASRGNRANGRLNAPARSPARNTVANDAIDGASGVRRQLGEVPPALP